MTELADNTTTTISSWSIIINIGLLILSIKFPILLIVIAIFSLSLGIYLVVTYMGEKNKIDEMDKTGILVNLLYGYLIFYGWTFIIMGVIALVIYFFTQILNKGKRNSSNL